VLTTHEALKQLKGQRVGIIANHTAISSSGRPTIELLKELAPKHGFTITALFAPEHGFTGVSHASDAIADTIDSDGIPIYGLYGKHRRPTASMLEKIDLLIYDLQDLGSRSYTYAATLFYAMEEAARHNVAVMVLDRPNPINGVVVDGPMLEECYRSMVGYINVPYCHGMTIGELARFFNGEYKVGCRLSVIPMRGWHRKMTFAESGLFWMPTSPQVPEATTALYYPVTGILGELSLVNIGVGYTLPFKVIGAPWIDARQLATALNSQKFPGVLFEPFHYKPFYGKFHKEECHGVLIAVTDPLHYKPVSTQYLIIGMLKNLYPKQMAAALASAHARREMFSKVNGTAEAYRLIAEESFITWKLCSLHQKEKELFQKKRPLYLIHDYR
jgi:uncharacterized protein YbbC (DUF1343 family)